MTISADCVPPTPLNKESTNHPGCFSTEDDDMLDTVDPFFHKITMTPWQWVRTFILTVTVLPMRVFLILATLVAGWAMSSMALWGVSEQELTAKPLLSWRARVRGFARTCGQLTLRFCGFLSVTVKGRRAAASEAPILVVAPHSTFFDAFAAFWGGHTMPYVVSRQENKNLPFIGKCTQCAQAVFVSREDPKSRQKTVQEIIRRSNCSSDKWPQLMIFPEGSTSNRQALMTFKPGAFCPGKPIQPVVLRYPNNIDTVTWTWNQPHGVFTVLWLTLCQVYSRAEMEFLPVYHPSEAEQTDPKLYASNVRNVMAAALGVPTSDVTFEDVKKRYGTITKKSK
jgi:lysophosphatidylcholine acyltransferase/lyso-PAF acetyltransferase